MSQRVFSYGAGVLFAAAGAACWSMAGGLVRLTEEVDAWQIVFYRSSVVLVCMMVWLGLRFRGDLWARTREAGVNAVIAGVAIGTAGLVFIISMFYTTVADAVFMTGVSPFLSGGGGGRPGDPDDVRIDFDGLEQRVVALPVDSGAFGYLAVNDAGQLLYASQPPRGVDGARLGVCSRTYCKLLEPALGGRDAA